MDGVYRTFALWLTIVGLNTLEPSCNEKLMRVPPFETKLPEVGRLKEVQARLILWDCFHGDLNGYLAI